MGTLRVEGQALQKRRRKLPDDAVAFAKEINGIIMAGPNEASVSDTASHRTSSGTCAKLSARTAASAISGSSRTCPKARKKALT